MAEPFTGGLLQNPFFAIGTGLMQSAGNPLNPYGGISQGLLAAQGARRAQTMDEFRRKQMEAFDAQERERQRKAETEAAQRELQAEAAQSLPPELQKLAMAYPQIVPKLLEAQMRPKDSGIGKIDPGKYTPQSIAKFQETGDYTALEPAPTRDSPFWSIQPTPEGLIAVNSRDPSQVRNLGLMRSTDDPALQGELAESRAANTAAGSAQGAAAAQLPGAAVERDRILARIDELSKHPGLDRSVGLVDAITPDLHPDARDFARRYEEVQGGVFLQARAALKGAGTVTDFESARAEKAYARMARSTTEKDFREALSDFREAVVDGYKKLEATAGATQAAEQPTGADAGTVKWADLP